MSKKIRCKVFSVIQAYDHWKIEIEIHQGGRNLPYLKKFVGKRGNQLIASKTEGSYGALRKNIGVPASFKLS